MIVREQLLGLRYFGASRSPSEDGAPQNLIQKFFRPVAHRLRHQSFGSVFARIFQFFVEASVAIASSVVATFQLGFWFWHDLEIEAELRAWYYHKPQSPFLVIFSRHLSWTAQTRHTNPWGVLADCSIKTGACLAFDDMRIRVTVGFGRFDGVGFSLTNLDLSSLSVFVSTPFQPLSTTGFAFLIVATGSLVAVGLRIVPGPVTFNTPLLMFEPGVFPF